MKNLLYTTSLVTVLFLTLISFYSCKKQKIESSEKPLIQLGGNPTAVIYPVFADNDKINDHLRHLAFGAASLMDPIYLQALTCDDYISGMENQIETDQEEVGFEEIKNNINYSIFKWYGSVGSPPYAQRDFYTSIEEAINWSNTYYNTLNIPRLLPWTGYDAPALGGFQYNNGGYATVFRIPGWKTLQTSPSRLSKPIVVVPNEIDVNDDIILPIIGFTYDAVNDKVDLVQWATEEDFEDETGYYIWVVDYEPIPITTGF